MTNREKAALQTRAKILKTGQKLIIKFGFENVSVQDITDAACVAKGTFYTYFKRKEDIIWEICRDVFACLVEQYKSDNKSDVVQKLTKYFHNFMQEVQRYSINITREWLRDVITPASVTDTKDAEKWFYDTDMLRGLLNYSIERGELKTNTPVDELTYIITSQLYGMMLAWCMSDEKFNPLDWTACFCELQLKQILKPYINN